MERLEKNEKERLELLEKRMEIQKMRIEIRKGKLNIDDRIESKQLVNDEHKILIEKVTELRHLLSDVTVDKNKTIMGSEPFYVPILDGAQRNVIMNKLIALVNSF